MITMTWPQYLRRQCTVDGRVICLSEKEVEILLAMLLRSPRPTKLSAMIEFVHADPDSEPDWAYSSCGVTMMRLRQKVGRHHIIWEPGAGYRLAQDIPLKDAA